MYADYTVMYASDGGEGVNYLDLILDPNLKSEKHFKSCKK